MAFELRRTESVSDGLRRLARKQLRSARARLGRADPPSVEAVHDARKSLKKVRAIVRLIDADTGRAVGASGKRLRSVSRKLAELRDADVMLECLSTLRRKYPEILSEHTFARVRRQLRAYTQKVARDGARDGTWRKIDRKLRTVRKKAKRWRPLHRGFGALAAGIRGAHRRGRQAMARARRRGRAADFHEWRREMKTLWYALRLIERSSPDVRRQVTVLRRAETWLGDDHNMVVLCERLSKDPSLIGPIDLKRLQCAVDAYQRQLREKTLSATRRIYAATSGAFVRRIRRAWKAWHRQVITDDANPTRASSASAADRRHAAP